MSPGTYETATKSSAVERAITFEPRSGQAPKLVIDEKQLPVSLYLGVGEGAPTKLAEITLAQVEGIFQLIAGK